MKGWEYVGVDTWRFAEISAVVARPISRTWRRNFESTLAVSIETVPRRHRVSTIRFGMCGCFRQERCRELYLEEAAGRVGELQTGAGSAAVT